MIDPHTPEAKQAGVLASQALSEAGSGSDFEIVQHNHRASGRMMQRQEKSMFALGRIGRAVDENQPRAHEALKRFPLRGDIKGFDRAKAIPAARQRNDLGIITRAFRDRSFQLFRAAEPIGGILDAGRGG